MGLFLPAALLFGIAVPAIIALYFLKLRRPERRVSSTFLWRQARRDLEANAPWQRLRISWLLILQLIAAAAVVLALARPYYLAPGGLSGDTVVLLQASASMRATDIPPGRFSAAQASVSELIDRLEPSATMTLVAMAEVPRVLVSQSRDRGALREALARVRPSAGPANLGAALSLAASLARERPDFQVIIVGDGIVEGAPEGELPFAVRFIQVGTSADNLAIAAFGIGPFGEGDGGQAALATVANHGPGARSTTLELYADGRLVDVRRLELGPGEERAVLWPELPTGSRVLRAHLSSGGALALDDDAWGVVAPATQARALLVSPGNVFLERALRLSPAVALAKTTPDAYAPGSYDLYVFDRFLPPTLPAGSILAIGPPAGAGTFPAGESEPVRRLIAPADGDELLRYVDLGEVHVAKARRIDPPRGTRTVIAAPAESSPLPLLLAGEDEGRRLALLTFDLHESDLPLQSAFPILVQNLLTYLAPGAAGGSRALLVGEPIPIHLRPTTQSAAIVLPDGRSLQVAPPFPPAPFADTAEPGAYALVERTAADGAKETDETSFFAVNYSSPAQSRLAPGALALAGQSNLGEAVAALTPQELWRLGVVLALLALGAEWWIYHRG